jgi:RNA ligase
MEGIVLRYVDTNERMKVKGEIYTALHRAISRLTPLNVWAAVRDQTEAEMKLLLPEEFYPEFDELALYFNQEFTGLWTEVDAYCRSIASMTDKDVGLMINTAPIRVRRFVFTARKTPGSWQLEPRNRNKLFEEFRPTGNVCAR